MRNLWSKIGLGLALGLAVMIGLALVADVRAVGQTVRFKLDSFPGLTLDGTVREIARMEAASVPALVLSLTGGKLPTRLDNNGASPLPAVVCYEVRASLPPPDTGAAAATSWLLPGCRGPGKITCGNWTCFEWARRKFFELWAI